MGNSAWHGGVSDGTTLWFIDRSAPDTAFAYNAATRARDASRDITLGNSEWEGGVSDGTTLWFITSTSPDTAFAYNAATRARDASRDITLALGSFWRGGVSDGTTLWFIDSDAPDTAFAYNAATRARDASRDITLALGDWAGRRVRRHHVVVLLQVPALARRLPTTRQRGRGTPAAILPWATAVG